MPNQKMRLPRALPDWRLPAILALLSLAGCGSEPALSVAQVDALRAACNASDILQETADAASRAEAVAASRQSALQDAEARLAEADAAHRALVRFISERGAMHDDPELQARFARSQSQLRDAQNDVNYARPVWQQADDAARELNNYLELVTLHAAALAYGDSALNFARSAQDSSRYAGLAETKAGEAQALASSRRALEARFSAEYADAEADRFSACNLQADELLEQGRRN